MHSRPTIRDVAIRAGVSRQTVSRVINGKPEVSPQTRLRVLGVIEELGYRPSAVARSMVTGRTCLLGCISHNLVDYTFACMIENAQAEARRLGYFVLTGSAPALDDVEPLLEEMLNRHVDGLIVINPHADDRYRLFLPLLKRGLPIAYLNDRPREEVVSCVRCDDLDGGYRATRYLIGLGHRAIATILGPTREVCTIDRLAGYRQALAEAGLGIDPALIVDGDWSPESGYHAVQHLLNSRRTFTAIFAQNDRMAIGAIRALQEAGLEVPGDVSVIGFDDIPLAAYCHPPLTTLYQPMEECGRRAVRLLVETIQNPNRPPEQVLLRARLVERASCAPPRS